MGGRWAATISVGKTKVSSCRRNGPEKGLRNTDGGACALNTRGAATMQKVYEQRTSWR